jgi:hypothetical protein
MKFDMNTTMTPLQMTSFEAETLLLLLQSGRITIEEFLTVAPLSFAPELLKMIRERHLEQSPPESTKLNS